MSISIWLCIVSGIALASGCAAHGGWKHGTISALSESKNPTDLCEHKVPRDVCVRCHPQLVDEFKAAGDWCPEHALPESQCLLCHPGLKFTPSAIPAGADYARLVEGGEDLASLDPHAVAGKVTLFDFYAAWCVPCQKLDEHIARLLGARRDLAYRRINIGGWETPVVKRYMEGVRSLPYVIVYDKRGQRFAAIESADAGKLDQAIEQAATR
jgi:thiol-disulfide isomerase/thioredoxin